MRNLKLKVKLDQVLEGRKMTQKQLLNLIEEKTGKKFRAAALSELYNNQRTSINREHLEIIASVLELMSVNDLLEFINTDEKKTTAE